MEVWSPILKYIENIDRQSNHILNWHETDSIYGIACARLFRYDHFSASNLMKNQCSEILQKTISKYIFIYKSS